jgi:hypothetical protein
MRQSREVSIGVAWYRPEERPLFLSLAADAEKLEETHEAWVAVATKTIEDLRKRGIVARKVDVSVREMLAWCQSHGRPLDGEARAAYVSEKLQAASKRPSRQTKRRRRDVR